MIPLSSRASRPVWDQVADSLRHLLRMGAFLPGDSLPPPETLARELAVNPGAVRSAYEALADQGLLERHVSGTLRVAALPKEDDEREKLLSTWDQTTIALLTAGLPRRELEQRLKEVGV